MINQEHKYYSVGFNYDSCPIEFRESLAIGEHELELALRSLQSVSEISEALILSTCNRTEIYMLASGPEESVRWLANFRNFNFERLDTLLYRKSGDQVVRQAFRVATGLDSMVLGETQILGQLKSSVRAAESAGTLGPKLRRLFDVSFNVAKYIRSETNVGAHSVSLAAASVKVGERIFGSLIKSKVLFVGAGDMNRVCAEYFASLNVETLVFANRTFSRAKTLASTLRGECILFSDIAGMLSEFDIVVSCTGSPLPIIGKGAVEKAIESRRHRPMLLIDLAVPRDIELNSSDLADVFLYTVDDLGEIVSDGMKNREAAAADAEKIIE
ncbi:MAG: glutamyl-tRNA reductase, partial [Burkholderiales bacterium]|nr:glutamyl-tRNA reductase [Burkholderiales bacterium]